MPIYVCLHSDAFQEYVYAEVEMQVSVLKECRILDRSSQLMTPSRQALLFYKFWNLQLHL